MAERPIDMTGRPLDGVRILSFTAGIAGPFGARLLGALGAEVIRVASKKRITADFSYSAPWGPELGLIPDFKGPTGASQWGEDQCVGIELTTPTGREVFEKLVKVSDVVYMSYATGAARSLGLQYERLREIKRDIIVIHMPAFGTTGPLADYATWGFNVGPMTGLIAGIGYPDMEGAYGLSVGGSTFTDFMGGFAGVTAVLAALHHRKKTGEGQYIQQSLYDLTAAFLGPAILDYVANGRVAGPVGNRSPYAAPHGVYRCRGEDRWCAIAVRSDAEWEGFCRAVENPDWVSDSRFATLRNRLENQDDLDRLVEEFTSDRDPYEVMFLMQEQGVPASVAQNGDDLLMSDLQLKARNFFTTVESYREGPYYTYGVPVKLSATPAKVTVGSASFGQHNDYVLKQLLGMTDAEVENLIEVGAVSAPIPVNPEYRSRTLANRWTGRLGSSLPRPHELKWSD